MNTIKSLWLFFDQRMRERSTPEQIEQVDKLYAFVNRRWKLILVVALVFITLILMVSLVPKKELSREDKLRISADAIRMDPDWR